MAEIKINVDELQNSIDNLNSLQSECESITLPAYDQVGSGKTFDVLNGLRSECELANSLLLELIQNTTSFLTSVKNSVNEADSKAAEKMN